MNYCDTRLANTETYFYETLSLKLSKIISEIHKNYTLCPKLRYVWCLSTFETVNKVGHWHVLYVYISQVSLFFKPVTVL